MTPVQDLEIFQGNHLFIKRDDLYPYCFGGNKARKNVLFIHTGGTPLYFDWLR